MHNYPKHIKRLIREYAARAYDIELSLALGELEQQFAVWHNGQISASELSDRIYCFTRGPARDLWSRYNASLDDVQVANALVTGLLSRDDVPVELIEALHPTIAFMERNYMGLDQELQSDSSQPTEEDDATRHMGV